jgi:hypothetical protein
MFNLKMHLHARVSTFISQFEKWGGKTYEVSDKASLSRNLGTNKKELHTPTSISKKPK